MPPELYLGACQGVARMRKSVLAISCSVAVALPLAGLLSLGAQSSSNSQTPGGIRFLHDVVFGKGGNRDLHAEIAMPEKRPERPMPAVIWIHGGGWANGTYKLNPASWLAHHGYFTASIEYRLSGEAKWPAQLEDCRTADRWLREHASEYGINPGAIGVMGASAGGHLAECLGTMEQAARNPKRGPSIRVQAVVSNYGVPDLAADGPLVNLREQLVGCTLRENPRAFKDASPINFVQAGDPPVLLVHGDMDTTVPIVFAERFEKALKRANVPVEMIRVRNAAHGLNHQDGAPPMEPDPHEIRRRILEFFDKHLKK